MKANFHQCTLADISEIVMGQSPPGDRTNVTGGGTPLLNGPTEFGSSHPNPVQYTTDPRKFSQPEDILFCVRGSTVGRMNWSDRQYAIGRGLAAIRHKGGIEYQHYLRALIKHKLDELLSSSTGSTFPNISKDQLSNIKIEVPPLPEQRAIARILGSLDDKIELNRHMNATLEAMAQAIFKSWFVDFDPVRAKMEGEEPAGLDAETATLFPDDFEVVDGQEVPKGWKFASLPDAIEVNPRISLRKGDSAPYLDMKNMPTQGHRAIEWLERPFGSGVKFVNGDTLIARITPCLENGKTAFVDFLKGAQVGWGSTEYIVFRPKSPLPKEYGYYLARSESLRDYAIQNMTGTSGRQRVVTSCFDNYPIVVPSSEVAQRFEEIVKPIMALIKQRDEESHTLAATRDTLLPKLISGEIRVPDAMLEAAEA